MRYADMDDDYKRKKIGEVKKYLNMDAYISSAVGIAERRNSVGSNRNQRYGVDSSEEFKRKMRVCVTYYNEVEEDTVSKDFVSKFIDIEKALKESHKKEVRQSDKELRNQVSELTELWRGAFGLKSFIGGGLAKEYKKYPYHPQIIHDSLAHLADKTQNPDFPNTVALRIIQDVEEMINSDDVAGYTEIEANFDIDESENINEDDEIAKSEFLASLENINRAKKEASYESLDGSSATSSADLKTLVSKYLIEEKGLDKNEIPSGMSVENLRNVFCYKTRDPETFRNSVDEIIIGMNKVGMFYSNVDSLGHVSKSNIVEDGEYGRNLARVLDRLCDYAQQAYDRAEELVEDDSTDDFSGW